MRENIPKHVYGSYKNFGHWNVENDQNPWLVNENIRKWSTSSQMIGNHFNHPHQKFARGMRNRMPTYQ